MVWNIDAQGREYTIDESVLKPLNPLVEAIERTSDMDMALFIIAISRTEVSS